MNRFLFIIALGDLLQTVTNMVKADLGRITVGRTKKIDRIQNIRVIWWGGDSLRIRCANFWLAESGGKSLIAAGMVSLT